MTTKKQIIYAAIQLLKTMPYERISITKICGESNFSRQTFYKYFKSIDEVYRSVYEEIFSYERVEAMRSIDYFYSDDLIINMIETYDEHADIFISMDQWNLLDIFSKQRLSHHKQLLETITYNETILKYPNYFLSYIFDPICSICLKWVKGGKKETKKELFDIIKQFQAIK